MGNQNAEFQEDEHYFHRLPEELILNIFNRVADLKSLFMCSLVSKYFASVISHVRSITITLPSSEEASNYSPQFFAITEKFMQELPYLKSEQIPALLNSLSLQKLKLPVFLEKFRKVESIYLKNTNFRNKLGSSPLIMWKAKCGSTMVDNLIALLPDSVHKKSSTGYELDREQQKNSVSLNFRMIECIWLSLGRYTEWLCRIFILIKSHSSLQSLRVAYSEKEGKLVIKDEQLVNIRSCLHEVGAWKDVSLTVESVKGVAFVPLLDLPLSGYIMRGVTLIRIKFPGETRANGIDDNITTWDLGEHETLLDEAVKEILKNHRNMILIP